MPICKVCNKEYASKYTLERHVESVHNDDEEPSTDDEEDDCKSDEPDESEIRIMADVLEDIVEAKNYSSVSEMLASDAYNEVLDPFKEKVF